MNTCNYLYNKTIEVINNGASISFYSLRDMLVTNETRKTHPRYTQLYNEIKELKERYKLDKSLKEEILAKKSELSDIVATKNININDWELNTPKDIRAGSVNDVCKAYKSVFSNLKAGNIFGFNMGFRKNNDDKSIVIQQNLINIKNGVISIAPKVTKKQCVFKMGRKTLKKHKNITVCNDVRLQKRHGEYWLFIPYKVDNSKRKTPVSCCGVDPGIRTFMTIFNDKSEITEVTYCQALLKKLNAKLLMLKDIKNIPEIPRCRKRDLLKIERRKENIITDLHWKTINELLNSYNVIFYGDIKSHAIVKNKKSHKNLNRCINDMRFYQFRQKLQYKADVLGKLVILVPEQNTTKTCSFCGTMKTVGAERIYTCDHCGIEIGRDVNSGRNMLIKGLTM